MFWAHRENVAPDPAFQIFTTRCWKNRHNFSPDHGNAAKFSKNIHLGLSFLQFPIKPRHLRKLVRRFGLTKNLLDGRICWFSFLWRGFQDPTVRRIIQRNLHESPHRLQQNGSSWGGCDSSNEKVDVPLRDALTLHRAGEHRAGQFEFSIATGGEDKKEDTNPKTWRSHSATPRLKTRSWTQFGKLVWTDGCSGCIPFGEEARKGASLGTLCAHNASNWIQIKFNPF